MSNIVETAKGEGWAEGREEGEHKKAVNVALLALKQGISADTISQITGLSVEDITVLSSETTAN